MILILIVVFSALFVVTHLGMSHGAIRTNLVAKLGEWPFRGVYSLVSFLTFGPAAVLWWQNRHLGPVLWEFSPWVERGVALVLMLVAVELIVLMLANPSPASMMPGDNEPRGILRVTRHPMNMGLALFGVAHILANGTVGDVAFFGQKDYQQSLVIRHLVRDLDLPVTIRTCPTVREKTPLRTGKCFTRFLTSRILLMGVHQIHCTGGA